MADIETIKAKIKTILETIEGGGLTLNEVFGYMENQPLVFPSAMIDIFDYEEARFDTANNEITVKFLIKVLIRDTNDSTSSDTRMAVIKGVTDVFRTSANVDTLNNEVERFDIERVSAFNKSEDMPFTGFDLILRVYFIKPIS